MQFRNPKLRRLLLGACAAVAMALMQRSTLSAANPAADLDQCRNGSFDAPVPCDGSAWVNGNAGASNAHWNEGESIAYRLRFSNLVSKTAYYVEIEWDTTQGGKHAIDYLTSYDRTMNGASGATYANPCSGVSGCSGSPTTSAIPQDFNTQLGASAADGRWNQLFKMWGATITSYEVIGPNGNPSYAVNGSYAGSSSTRIYINFIPTTANPVLAWGGHIATRKDWNPTCPTTPGGCSAVAISGSPFHMRLVGLSGVGGNQDRSLSSAAVTFPAVLRITKEVKDFTGSAGYVSPTRFGFTASSPSINGAPEVPATFDLWDDTPTNPDTTPKTVSYNLLLFKTQQAGNQVVISEDSPTDGFAFESLTCNYSDGGLGIATGSSPAHGVVTTGSSTATIYVNEAQIVDCTYVNKQQGASLTLKKLLINDHGSTAQASAFTMHIKTGGSDITDSPFAGSASGVTRSVAPGTYVVSEVELTTHTRTKTECQIGTGSLLEVDTVTLKAGESATCTITNDDKPATLIVEKLVINDNGGTKKAVDFSFQVNGASAVTFLEVSGNVLMGKNELTVSAGSYTVTEPDVTGYTKTVPTSCAGIVLINGASATCTITNDDDKGKPTLITVLSWHLYDKAVIGSEFIPDGSGQSKVTFKLYGPGAGCSTLIHQEDSVNAVTAAGDYPAATGKLVTVPGTYHWVASWPGDGNNEGKSTACGDESHTITVLPPPQ